MGVFFFWENNSLRSDIFSLTEKYPHTPHSQNFRISTAKD